MKHVLTAVLILFAFTDQAGVFAQGGRGGGATQLRGHDGQVKQGEQEVPGQTSGATQRCLNP